MTSITLLQTLFFFYNFIFLNNAKNRCDFFNRMSYNINKPCLNQLNVVCNNTELVWKMFDASSKLLIPGMTYTNVIDYGNFPECLSINYNEGEIIGKYCGLSVMILHFSMTPQVKKILKSYKISTRKSPQVVSLKVAKILEAQLRNNNASVILAKYSTCVPDACTPREVGYYHLYDHFNDVITNRLNFSLISYTDLPCETLKTPDFDSGDIAAIVFFAVIALLMTCSTIYEAWCQNFETEPYHPILLSFSIISNGKKLLYISNNTTEQIQCFNGMRFISMMWVVALHSTTPYEKGLIALENFPDVKAWNKKWTSQYIHSGVLSVDTFFFMSGFLLAFIYLNKSSEKLLDQIRKVPKMYLHRYLRLTPSMGAMYIVMITIYRYLGTGPTWTLLADLMKRVCRSKWWKFFLYVQNYTDPDEMCVAPMWYLSAEMQMFILAPLVLIPTAIFIKKRFKNVVQGLVIVTTISILVPIFLKYFLDKGPGNINATHTRFNNYLIGITFGAVMRMKKQEPYIFGPWTNFTLWIVVLVVSLSFNIYWFDVSTNYELLKYTLFYGLYRPVWCLCLVFMVYSCYHNQGGVVQWFLTRPAFQILGKLSYCMYILHLAVELYAGAVVMTPTYFSNYVLFYNWCGHIIVTMILAVFWVLAFEYPILTIDKYILDEENKKEK